MQHEALIGDAVDVVQVAYAEATVLAEGKCAHSLLSACLSLLFSVARRVVSRSRCAVGGARLPMEVVDEAAEDALAAAHANGETQVFDDDHCYDDGEETDAE